MFRRLLSDAACRVGGFFAVGVVVFLVMLSASPQIAVASHCGSYVIANPVVPGKHSTRTTALLVVGGAPHIPTPCELGFCEAPVQAPIAPPSVPTVKPLEQLFLQVTSTMPLCCESQSQLITGSAQPRSGFHRQLERPPELRHV